MIVVCAAGPTKAREIVEAHTAKSAREDYETYLRFMDRGQAPITKEEYVDRRLRWLRRRPWFNTALAVMEEANVVTCGVAL